MFANLSDRVAVHATAGRLIERMYVLVLESRQRWDARAQPSLGGSQLKSHKAVAKVLLNVTQTDKCPDRPNLGTKQY